MKQGVLDALAARFPDFAVYEGELPETPAASYFHVRLSPVTQERQLGRRYRRTYGFDIALAAPTPDERLETADALLDELVYIEVDGVPCRGSGLKHELVDGVLRVYAQYELQLVREAAEEVRMQHFSQKGSIKA
ncbi:hypothetical protein PA598K_04203 [Paenibacillus sp. 598K]|nr:hypothetical protein PA598K_04203 [Paenibacillus sp. 598K]